MSSHRQANQVTFDRQTIQVTFDLQTIQAEAGGRNSGLSLT